MGWGDGEWEEGEIVIHFNLILFSQNGKSFSSHAMLGDACVGRGSKVGMESERRLTRIQSNSNSACYPCLHSSDS